MKLNQEQIDSFKEIHKNSVGFEKYSDEEITEIANSIANYYLTLYKVRKKGIFIKTFSGKTPDG
jgi:hypothetical protein